MFIKTLHSSKMATSRKSDSFILKTSDEDTKLCNRNAAVKQFKGFQDLWEQQKLCDVIIKTSGEQILAHRAVLAVHCDYFKAMFSMGFQESTEQIPAVTLNEVSAQTVKDVIKYMYTGNLTLNKDNIQELVVITDLLQMVDLKQQCSHWMEEELNASNCLGVWEFSENYGCDSLFGKSEILIKQRFPIVYQLDEFLHISSQKLCRILQFKDLYLGHSGEDLAMSAVFRWLEHKPEERLLEFGNIIKHIRLRHVTQEQRQLLLNSQIAQLNIEIKQIVDAQLATQEDLGPRESKQYLYVMGGYLQSRTGPLCPRLNGVERYDCEKRTWESLSELPILASAVYSFELYSRLFCIAYSSIKVLPADEQQKEVKLEGFYEYNILQNQWKDAADSFSTDALKVLYDCMIKFGSIAVCSLTNKIYAVTTDTVTCLEPELDDGDILCKCIKHLQKIDHTDSLINFVATVCEGKLYVIGGYLKMSQLELQAVPDTLMYDEDSMSWVKRCPMLEPRAQFDAVVLDGCIYAIGGVHERRLNTVEKYDPESDHWSPITSMDKSRSYCKALVNVDKIFVMGGKTYANRLGGGARKVTNTCEMYDSVNNTWSYIPSMKNARCMFGAATY